MPTDDRDDRSEPPAASAIDVEDRLWRVKRAAGQPRLRRRLARLAGEPAHTDRMLIAAAGSACATTAVLTYLWWRDGRAHRHPRLRGRRAAQPTAERR